MNLIIDIGNTQAKLVAFDGTAPIEEIRTSNKTLDALPQMLERYSFEKAIVASVTDISPAAEKVLSVMPFDVLQFSSSTPVPYVVSLYRTPQTLGVDRISAVVGAVYQRPERDILVIDSGTCITYEFVDHNGRYIGGNISPGLQMRLESLNEKTSRLPIVEKNGDTPLLGYDTKTAVRSGVLRGMRYEIEGYINEFLRKYPSLVVFFTGGGGFDFDTQIKNIIFADKYLVARGLNRILEYNYCSASREQWKHAPSVGT